MLFLTEQVAGVLVNTVEHCSCVETLQITTYTVAVGERLEKGNRDVLAFHSPQQYSCLVCFATRRISRLDHIIRVQCEDPKAAE